MNPAELTKAALRTNVRRTLDAVPPERWREASRRICEHVARLETFRKARTIFAFVPISGEVDISPLLRLALELGKVLCLPRIEWATRTMVPAVVTALDDTQLESTRHAIRQPRAECRAVSGAELDLILVPALAFALNPTDPLGRITRLGRGAGFYDRFFESQMAQGGGNVPPHTPARTLGIALSEQILASIPADPWDVSVGAVATPDGVIGAV